MASALSMRQLHDVYVHGPFSQSFFTFYAAIAQLWHWVALIMASSGGHGACDLGDRTCVIATQILVFAASPQKAIGLGVETGFQVLMGIWIVGIISCSLVLVLR